MAVIIQFRNGTAQAWFAANPVLLPGEIGVETDTDLFKIGNGTTAWNALPYANRGPQGEQGERGLQGEDSIVPGPQGPQGNPGVDGLSLLSGGGAPGAGLGVNGDFYINILANTIYGPKTGGSWGSPTSLVGPAGSNGSNGTNGTNGLSILNGNGAPGSGIGVYGDFYIDTAGNDIYGPKTSGGWGSATNLVGPAGEDGEDSTVPGPKGDDGDKGDKGDKGDSGSVAGSFGISIDGAGSAITAGLKQYLTMPFACTITGWHLVGTPSGSVVMDVWKANGALPTVSDSITGTEKPTLSSADLASDTNLSTWTTSVLAGDIIAFNVDSCSGCRKLTLTVAVTK